MNDALLWSGRALSMLAVHGAAVIVVVWLLERVGVLRSLAIREWFWRCAVFAGLVSSSLQLTLVEPLTGHWTTPPTTGAMPLAATVAPATTTTTYSDAGTAPVRAADRAERRPAMAIAEAPRQPAQQPSSASMHGFPDAVITQWPLLVLALWLAAAAMRLIALVRAGRQLRAMRWQAVRVDHQGLLADADFVAQRMRMATPCLASIDGIDSPMALPGRLVLLPAWALASPSSQRRALLAHEFAHVQRRDPEWRVALAGWRALACGIPLLGVALRRLDHLAELQCDDTSARLTGKPQALAECLARAIHHHQPVSIPAFAAAMATPHSPILQRAERLLEGVPVSESPLSWKLRAAPLLAIASAVLLIPSLLPIAITPAQASIFDGTRKSLHITDDDGNERVTLRRDGRTLDYRSHGAVAFNDNESDIASLAPGATARLEESVGGVTRRIDFSLVNGVIQRDVQRDGKPAAFDAQAQQWLAATIPSLLRETAIDAPARVARLHKAGGAKAVLDEIERMQSGSARSRYLEILLPMAPLQGDDLTRAITLAGAIDSDHDRAEALTALLKQRPLEPAQQLVLLEQARRIGSDHQLGELLMAAAPNVDDDEVLQDAWFKAVAQIGSDHEQQEVLVALLQKAGSNDRAVLRVLGAMDRIGSDHSRGEVLAAVAAGTTNADAIAPAYAKAIIAMGSDHDRGEAASALIAAKGFGAVSARELLTVADAFGSDYSRTQLLVDLAAVMPIDAGLVDGYRKVASRLPDYNRGEVERALDQRTR